MIAMGLTANRTTASEEFVGVGVILIERQELGLLVAEAVEEVFSKPFLSGLGVLTVTPDHDFDSLRFQFAEGVIPRVGFFKGVL